LSCSYTNMREEKFDNNCRKYSGIFEERTLLEPAVGPMWRGYPLSEIELKRALNTI